MAKRPERLDLAPMELRATTAMTGLDNGNFAVSLTASCVCGGGQRCRRSVAPTCSKKIDVTSNWTRQTLPATFDNVECSPCIFGQANLYAQERAANASRLQAFS